MNKLTTYTALVAAALTACLSQNAWSDETPASESAAVAEQTPAPESAVAPVQYPPALPGGYAQTWQQPPHWRAPQQVYGHFPPPYPQLGQYPAYPAAPATARENPLSAELKQTQDRLNAKSTELDAAHSRLDQLRGELQECLAADARLTDEIDYSTREQQALRVRVTELISTLNTARATLEQQHQLISDHQAQYRQLSAERDQLQNTLAGRDEQLAALQSELQAARQALAQASARASSAAEALTAARLQIEAHRDALAKLGHELERQGSRLQEDPHVATE